jgi:hypothetical protein
LVVLFSLCPLINSGQSTLKGFVLREKDSSSVANAYVVLKKAKNNSILSYAVTDKDGSFKFDKKLYLGVYTLKIQHLNLASFEKKLVIDSIMAKAINIILYVPEKSNKLNEIVINSSSPILIKQDTIIYNIPHFADKFDEDLESVLKKIKGFEILPNGDIKVKGKKVRKVLIDGKEMSNSGSALITKSLNPKSIKSVEVRFDEQNTVIKESLLDATKYVVLDIKLKNNLKKSFFGKFRLTSGKKDNLKIGGYLNTFSLNKKNRFHLFSEYDNFGHQTISLLKIRNIGQEALEKLFERPADFKEFTKREAFNEEIYGFKDYNEWFRSIIGLTSRIDLSKKWNLYFGSYNSFNNKLKEQNATQFFVDQNNLFLKNTNRGKVFNSKNKIELRYDDEKSKLKLNTNYVSNNNRENQIQNIPNNLDFNFNTANKQENWYNNLFVEKILNPKLGLEAKASYAVISSINDDAYLHNSLDIATILIDSLSNPTFNYGQLAKTKFNDFYLHVGLNYNTKIGDFKYGYTQKRRNINYSQKGVNSNTQNQIIGYNLNKTSYLYRDYTFLINHFLKTTSFTFSNTISLTHAIIPKTFSKLNNSSHFNYNFKITYSPIISTTYRVNYINKLSSYPLLKHILAKKILDYQTVQLPASNIELNREQTIEASIYKTISITQIDISFLNGVSHNNNIYGLQDSFFVSNQLGQLSSKYNIASIAIKTKPHNFPLEFILEPEAIWYRNDNLLNNISYLTKTKWWLLGLKINARSKNKFNFKLYPKFTRIEYLNDLSNLKSHQNMMSTKLNFSYKLFKKHLKVDVYYRNVSFKGISHSTFNNLDIYLKGAEKKWHWNLEVSNILKSNSYNIQNNNPVFLINQSNILFGRYVKLGLEFYF